MPTLRPSVAIRAERCNGLSHSRGKPVVAILRVTQPKRWPRAIHLPGTAHAVHVRSSEAALSIRWTRV
jgi:hypothetical protein